MKAKGFQSSWVELVPQNATLLFEVWCGWAREPSCCARYWAPQTRALVDGGTVKAHRTDVRILWPVDIT